MSSSKLDVEGTWPLIGYAPGGYTSLCAVCDEHFEGHKRAFNCLPCAALRANALLAERKALVEASQALVDACDSAPPMELIKRIGECADMARAALALTGGQS